MVRGLGAILSVGPSRAERGIAVIRHPGRRSGVQEMAGRDARRYQIVGTGVPAGAGFPRTRE